MNSAYQNVNFGPLIFLVSLFFAIIVCIVAIYLFRRKWTIRQRGYSFNRHHGNPVLSPSPFHDWEAEGTFNPSVVEDDDGQTHIFYRAIGKDGLSRIGHAVGKSDNHVYKRTFYPVYEPLPGYGMPEASEANMPHHYDADVHPSGGGWGGAEDPKTTRIGDRVYMTYTAFEGWNNMRIGLTSISVEDMENERWKWKRPIIISPKKPRAKNWVLFPEKIGGKYAILHSVAPKVLVSYVDSLDAIPVIKSSPDHGGYGVHDKSREEYWDKIVKGAGPPPLKTSEGWLLLYHAIEGGKYKIGAMILDLNDPTKILYRSPAPILSPEMPYENDGKPGIVYAGGAVIKKGMLLVYYGGGDKHTCVAETPLAPLLDWLKKYGRV